MRTSDGHDASGADPGAGTAKLWGGRFDGGGLDPFFEAFNRSLPFDRRLIDVDILGSMGWVDALGEAGVLQPDESERLMDALEDLRTELEEDESALEASDAEDVHSFVEGALTAKVGDLARKLHTGRSRNDQVATDLRLWCKLAGAELGHGLTGVARALCTLADEYADAPMPGFTHLQRAQPITVGHHALAYLEMFARDAERVGDAIDRGDFSPLGCGALAGTAFPIDREELAESLGFLGPCRNSLDAVSDRDFVCELVFACSLAMLHLSRLAEDWILFASQETGFLHFGNAVATGSSLMPQKKNPDGMELIRGKAGRVVGALQTLLMTIKGLPLAYNKDLQEDKEALFDAVDTTVACLRIAATAIEDVRFDRQACRAAASSGYLNATDLADLLVRAGIPFRDAHERAGMAVRTAIEAGCELEDLPSDTLKQAFPELDVDWRQELAVDAVLARRAAIGGTAPERVRAEVERWRERLSAVDDTDAIDSGPDTVEH